MAFFCSMCFKHFLSSFFLLVFFGCKKVDDKTGSKLFQLQTSSGIDFINTVKDSKDFNVLSYRNFYNGAGVGIGDINNDGLADIFFTSNQGDNKLYLNKGKFKFEDITSAAGILNSGKWATGVVLADINNDGFLDIYVCYAGYQHGKNQENELYLNKGNLTFKESAATIGLNDNGYTTHASFFDYDSDGDLDCFVINNSFIPVNTLNYANKRDLNSKEWPVADFLKGGGNRLLKNENGKYIDVTTEAGIHSSLISFGLGVTVADVNGDNYPDIYVSNDFFERDYLYINQKNGTYKDELETWLQHISLASMGADIGDINNDGYPDIFTTDMLPDDDYRLKTTSVFDNIDVYRYKQRAGFYNQFMQNTLQLNNGNGKFMDIAYYSGVAASDWSWGGLMFDMDNDGLTDIFVCNGIYHDVTNQDFIDFFANDIIQKMALTGKKEEVDQIINKMPSFPIINKAFINNGNLTFADKASSMGFDQPSFSNGAAYGDLDNDGDLDLVINNVNSKSFIYKNTSIESNKNNYIGILLRGKDKNTFAIGSTVHLYQGKKILTREVMPSHGFQSSVDYKLIFGLGNQKVDSMRIVWPDRSKTVLINPVINKVHAITQTDSVSSNDAESPKEPIILKKQVTSFDKHVEDDYVDFYQERNIPMLLSREGPRIAVGDVNGDSLEDVYMGGGAGQGGQLYLQTSSGYVKKQEKIFSEFKASEDIAVLLFDCDNDKDLDLFVGAGGNNHAPGNAELQNRLYRNDGKGNFSYDKNDLPASGLNTSVVIANDFDNDGDLDLFVGSRSVPTHYGEVPVSYLYLNDGKGHFTDIAKNKNKDIAGIGLVTDAIWTDVTGGHKNDLVIVGEWMTPRIFSFEKDHFIEVKTNMLNMFGMWQSVNTCDIDNDGDEDIILGNIGENFYLKPNSTHPVKMWVTDFDRSGALSKVITRTLANKDVPVFMKKDMTDQMVSLRKQNFKYGDYARKSVQDLFSPGLFKNLKPELFNFNSSCVAINEGHGQFTIKLLPTYVQFSSVNAILPTDLNNDGNIDLVLGGNMFGFLPQFSRVDASYGHVLLNDGKGKFTWLPPNHTGLEIPGEIKDIVELKNKKNKNLLFSVNNDYPILYKVQSAKK